MTCTVSRNVCFRTPPSRCLVTEAVRSRCLTSDPEPQLPHPYCRRPAVHSSTFTDHLPFLSDSITLLHPYLLLYPILPVSPSISLPLSSPEAADGATPLTYFLPLSSPVMQDCVTIHPAQTLTYLTIIKFHSPSEHFSLQLQLTDHNSSCLCYFIPFKRHPKLDPNVSC